ncbi:hypothetical protein FEDK69T_02430 [Flavobacterium enshiense DK69]|uniref:Uncharacterized protein n=1 Tax=Flavobacterium enshiense DK69 TaxID=1107311 RepID=V6SEC7_9FLAO|nr:hypothetical protein [Flavobacterium enshiense]ESU25053.1 hypothetical protein FEDK69T_02430 [Flavobacterium enshiense DK69]KGO96847.1 hypothetical protein Q767_03870 [Flavobacterium enshiense DK69]
MKTIRVTIDSNDDILNVVDKNLNYIFIHKFMPNAAVEWWKTDLKMKTGEVFDFQVRNMEFDIQTDLDGLKIIIELNTNQLRIYQFDRPVPSTLSLELLPEKLRESILKQNGLKHIFFCDFEFLSISSFDEDYIDRIEIKR